MISALTIAGSDSGGGAGIQADLKTFEAHDVYGTSVLTALTAQNTVGVQDVMAVPASFVLSQLNAVLDDFNVGAAKTGMLFDSAIISTVADRLRTRSFPLVIDPVMVSTSGHRLLKSDAEQSLTDLLIPLADILTPNIQEGEILSGMKISNPEDMESAAQKILSKFSINAVLLKGGHFSGLEAKDFLIEKDGTRTWLTSEKIDTPNTHGTGCTLSAAVAANLAKGIPLQEAVRQAKYYVTGAIRYSWASLGKGRGTLRHNYTNMNHEH